MSYTKKDYINELWRRRGEMLQVFIAVDREYIRQEFANDCLTITDKVDNIAAISYDLFESWFISRYHDVDDRAINEYFAENQPQNFLDANYEIDEIIQKRRKK